VKESLFMMATRHVDNVIKNTFLQWTCIITNNNIELLTLSKKAFHKASSKEAWSDLVDPLGGDEKDEQQSNVLDGCWSGGFWLKKVGQEAANLAARAC
jgi:hypothetical protein